MIVNLTADGWDVIYHRAHALLAAQLGGQWQRSNAPVCFYETIAAISHHDDLEKEWKGDHLTESGAPLDFTLGEEPPEVSLEKLKKHLEDSLYRGRWVAFLKRYDLRCLENAHLTVEPWPFEEDEFTVNVESSHLSTLKYDSNDALTLALKQAPIINLEWTFDKS